MNTLERTGSPVHLNDYMEVIVTKRGKIGENSNLYVADIFEEIPFDVIGVVELEYVEIFRKNRLENANEVIEEADEFMASVLVLVLEAVLDFGEQLRLEYVLIGVLELERHRFAHELEKCMR